MENASNALIISAAVLIAVIVLSIGVYLVINFSKVSESYEQEQRTEELAIFNSKFMAFKDRSDISAQEIVTLKNFVEKYNSENDPDIDFVVNGLGINTIYTNKIEFIKDNSTITKITPTGPKEELVTFTCGKKGGVTINSGVEIENDRVIRINFTKNP